MLNVELYLQEMGKRIMERRKKLGLTQEALAEKSELTTQFVSYAESGKTHFVSGYSIARSGFFSVSQPPAAIQM